MLIICFLYVGMSSGGLTDAGQEQSSQAFGERDASNQQNRGNIFDCTHNSSGEM